MDTSNPLKQHLIDLDYKRKAANRPPFLSSQKGGRISGEVLDVNANLKDAMRYYGGGGVRQKGGILPALAAIPPAMVTAAPAIGSALGSAATAIGVPVAVDLVLDKIRSRRSQKGNGFYRPRMKRRQIDSYTQLGGSGGGGGGKRPKKINPSLGMIKEAILTSPHKKDAHGSFKSSDRNGRRHIRHDIKKGKKGSFRS